MQDITDDGGDSSRVCDNPAAVEEITAEGPTMLTDEARVKPLSKTPLSMSSVGRDYDLIGGIPLGSSALRTSMSDGSGSPRSSNTPSPSKPSPPPIHTDSTSSILEIRRAIASSPKLQRSHSPSQLSPVTGRREQGNMKLLQRSHTVGGRGLTTADFLKRSSIRDTTETPPVSPVPGSPFECRSRARSLSPTGNRRGSLDGEDGMKPWLVSKLDRVLQQMTNRLHEASENLSSIATTSSPSTHSTSNSVVMKERIQSLIEHLLGITSSDNSHRISSDDFKQTISACGKILGHELSPDYGVVVKKILLAIAQPARLVECLEFDPQIHQQEGAGQGNAADMTLDNCHLPRYVLDKMTTSFDRSSSAKSLDADVEDAKTDAARAKFLDLLKDHELPCKSDFNMVKLISSGAYGSVFIAKHKVTSEQFAIKVLSKKEIQSKNCVNQVMAEKEVLQFAQNPFVIQFFCSFSTHHSLYIVMEYAPGGDLGTLVRAMGCLTEREARRYFAETALALEYIHDFGIIHRDIKPENLVISETGHIKLTDFGLSKIGMASKTMRILESTANDSDKDIDSTFQNEGGRLSPRLTSPLPSRRPSPTPSPRVSSPGPSSHGSAHVKGDEGDAVGTPDYMAPEVILGQPYGVAADWWSMGILMYEFVVGLPPFCDESVDAVFQRALNDEVQWDDDPEFPLSAEIKNLVGELLNKHPESRLGSIGPLDLDGIPVENIQQIKQHPFFQLSLEDNGCTDGGIQWDQLLVEKACIVPTLENDLDTSYFDSRESRYDVRQFSREVSPTASAIEVDGEDQESHSRNSIESVFSNFAAVSKAVSPQDREKNLGNQLRTVFADARSPVRSNTPVSPTSHSREPIGLSQTESGVDQPAVKAKATVVSLKPTASQESNSQETVEYKLKWDNEIGLGFKIQTVWVKGSWQHRITDINSEGPAAAAGLGSFQKLTALLSVNGTTVAGLDKDRMMELVVATKSTNEYVVLVVSYPRVSVHTNIPVISDGGRASVQQAINYQFVIRKSTHVTSKNAPRRKPKSRAKGKARAFLNHATRSASRFMHGVFRSLSPSRQTSFHNGNSGSDSSDVEDHYPSPRSRRRLRQEKSDASNH